MRCWGASESDDLHRRRHLSRCCDRFVLGGLCGPYRLFGDSVWEVRLTAFVGQAGRSCDLLPRLILHSVSTIELLYWDGCPSHPEALRDLRAALDELGHQELEVALVEVASEDQAREYGFIGSPTLRIDGVDPVPPPGDEPPGLTCRVYRLRDGRYSPTPDPVDLRDALRRLLPPSAEEA